MGKCCLRAFIPGFTRYSIGSLDSNNGPISSGSLLLYEPEKGSNNIRDALLLLLETEFLSIFVPFRSIRLIKETKHASKTNQEERH